MNLEDMPLEDGEPLPDATLQVIKDMPGESPKGIHDLIRILDEEERGSK